MLVFWWHGRGYQTIWIWLVTMCAFGVVAAIGKPYVPDRPWYWGAAFCAAAAVNWNVGTKLNSLSIQRRHPTNFWQRLFYKAKHRFMSLPMETFSLVLMLGGVAIAAQGLLAPSN